MHESFISKTHDSRCHVRILWISSTCVRGSLQYQGPSAALSRQNKPLNCRPRWSCLHYNWKTINRKLCCSNPWRNNWVRAIFMNSTNIVFTIDNRNKDTVVIQGEQNTSDKNMAFQMSDVSIMSDTRVQKWVYHISFISWKNVMDRLAIIIVWFCLLRVSLITWST